MRKFSTEPWVACVTATRPGTPQLPPRSQGGDPADFEMALAITSPISKKVPEVAAAPMRKNRASCPLGEARPQRKTRAKTAAGCARHDQRPNLADIVSPERQQFWKTTRINTNCNTRRHRSVGDAQMRKLREKSYKDAFPSPKASFGVGMLPASAGGELTRRDTISMTASP